MEFYHFTEFAWPHLPPDNEFTSMRLNLPSSVYDPKRARTSITCVWTNIY